METKVIKADRKNIKKEDLTEAGEILRAGGLVAFPTETVYGLGGDGLNPDASKKIYAAKGRPSDNPLIIHIADKEDIKKLAVDIPDLAWKLADKFWPGPMTMILKKGPAVPRETTGDLDTVAIRLPSDEIARTLIRESQVFVAAPSANSSGRPSPTKAEHVIEDLSGKIDMIIDGGSCDIGLESSIIDLSGDKPLILRPGFITREDFEAVAEGVEYDKAVIAKTPEKNVVAKAPGMKYRHYAPKGTITIVEGDTDKVVEKINAEVALNESRGVRTAVICSDENKSRYKCKNVYDLGSRKHELDITSSLFDVLRQLDSDEIGVIFAESFDELRLSQAIMNRLRKAAGYNTVRV
ncbi:MAG: threonylcarbamoyl-AMP synthase [Lachnospiraceae bacterium]|nr:threonylcarbamoyl-AMP synthase [Lachnospiraceae bacterium]